MRTVTFGYAGKWDPNYTAVQQAANLVKSTPTPVGVAMYHPTIPIYQVVTHNEYNQATQEGRLVWTA